jgi:SAM-dependent methyltransferase
MDDMNIATRQRLLALNQEFYATVAEPFNQTRMDWPAGMVKLLSIIPHGHEGSPVQVADIGCGNGRFACMLDSRGVLCIYTGVDADEQLLALARKHTANLRHTQVRFVQADIARPGWSQLLNAPPAGFDAVVCLATLQHIPGYGLRSQVVRELTQLMATDGLLILSAWQFLTSERFVARQIDWHTIGVRAEEVEPGDALLPWKQGQFAIRYVHQIDAAEIERLAAEVGLDLVELFRADGKEGNLNLYGIFKQVAI